MTPTLRPLALALLVSAFLLPQPAPATSPQDEDLTQFLSLRTGVFYRFNLGESEPGGASAGEGDVVTFNYVGTDAKGHEFANTAKSGKPAVVTLGRESGNYFAREYDKSPVDGLGKGWDQMLRMMRQGDHVTLIMPPELAVLPGAPLLPQDGRLHFDVKVSRIVFAHEVAKEQAKQEMAAEKVAVPADSKALEQLGYQALYESHDPQKALKYFRWNVALFPQQAELYNSLGEGYLQAGDIEHAIDAYSRAGKNDNAQLVVARLAADPRSLSWLQGEASKAYRASKEEKAG